MRECIADGGLLCSPLIRIYQRLTLTASAAYNKSDRNTDIRGLDRAVLKEKEETVLYAADCREKTNAAATGPACAFTMNLYRITENARSGAQKNASWYQT